MLRATQFLSGENQQRFGVEVADFLFGNVNDLPAGLDVPNPDIPADVKRRLPQLLPISGNESDEEICEKIRVFGVQLFGHDVDRQCSPVGSVLRPSEAALTGGTSMVSSQRSDWNPWA